MYQMSQLAHEFLCSPQPHIHSQGVASTLLSVHVLLTITVIAVELWYGGVNMASYIAAIISTACYLIYPDAVFYGFDISPALFPIAETLPFNVHLGIMDIKQPIPLSKQSKYDLFHLRLIAADIAPTEWELVVHNIIQLLKPGGCHSMGRMQLGRCPASTWWHTILRTYSAIDGVLASGLALKISSHMAGRCCPRFSRTKDL
ncbi:0b16cd51-15ae-49c9-80ac-5ad179dcf495-CDS [Sclerotinia trifoliorum]|uniref:0b16cd51-15ae-49c9-80ac-5ad179dcf495-CDS n=1 Tax=Sclerotinia trifoliorum TaxID=28548 RepID=A0A8H2W2B8_9HELO|nr:0b16cd51-15ae-49c9-80ac-5ad179dcf495-CDS [Sclerotinia trifoliorum]